MWKSCDIRGMLAFLQVLWYLLPCCVALSCPWLRVVTLGCVVVCYNLLCWCCGMLHCVVWFCVMLCHAWSCHNV